MVINNIECNLLYGYSATRNFKVLEQTTTSNKKFYADYGYSSDDVIANFTLTFAYNDDVAIANMLTLNDELIQGSSVSLLCSKEYIFGSEIDYSSELTAYVVSVSQPVRTAYERHQLTISLIMKNPPRNTSVPSGSLTSLIFPTSYTYGYREDRAVFSGVSELSTLYMYTGSNTLVFSCENELSTNTPIKTYLSYNLRTNSVGIPNDWKTNLKSFVQFNLDYITMRPTITETFNKFGNSTLSLEFIGENK